MDPVMPEGVDLPPAAAAGARVLVLAADKDRAAERARRLTQAGLESQYAFASTRAELVSDGLLDCDLVLADVSLRAKSLVSLVRRSRPDLPVVILGRPSTRHGRPTRTTRPDPGIVYCEDESRLAGVLKRALGQDRTPARVVPLASRDEVLDLMAEGVVQDDPQGMLTFVNRAAAEMLGYRPEELLGKPRQVLYPPDQAALVDASDERRRQSRSDRYELELLHRDGRRVPVLASGSPRFVDGRLAGTTAVFTGIWGLKQSEETLRKTAETLQAMIRASPVAITTLDRDGRVTLWNAAAEKVFGWTAEEALGKPLPFVPPESQDEHRALRQRVLQGEWLDGIEVDRRRKDGSLVVIRLSTAPMHGPDGDVIGILGMMADVTEEKKAVSAMAESEVKFRTLAEESPNMIFINRRGRVLYANKKAAEVMGYERHEFAAPDFDFTRLLAPESRDEALRNFHRHQAGNEVPPALYTLIARDGRRVEGIHNTRIIDYGGEAAILGIVTDVTEQRRDEEALRKSEAMLSESQRVAAVGHYDLIVAKGTWTSSEMLDEIFGIGAEHPRTIDSWLGIVHADHRAELHAYLRDSVLKEKNAFDREYPIVRVSDGSTRWVHGLGRLQFDADGEPARMFGVIQDVTEKKQAEQALARRAAQLQVLAEIGAHFMAVAGLDELLSRTAALVQERLGYEHVGIFLCANDGSLVQQAKAGPYASHYPPGHRIASGRGLVGAAVSGNETVLANDVTVDPRYVNHYPDVVDTRSELCVPIRSGGGTVGVLDVQSRTPDAFNETDIQVLGILSDQLGTAISNARLYGALSQSEERYRLFLQNFDGIAYQVEAESWQPRFFHGKVEGITGIPAQAFVDGRTRWDQLIHPDDLPRIADQAGRMASGETASTDSVYRIRRADGSERWVRDVAARLPTRDGGHALLQGAVYDVTERLRAETALRQSEERYRALTENSAVGIYRTTPDGEILFANPAAVRMLGFESFADLAQRNLETEGFEPAYPRLAFKERLEREGTIIGLESAWRRRDGTAIFVRENARILRDERGDVVYEGTVEDITERKVAEQAMRHLSEFNESIVSNMAEGIVFEGVDGTFSFVNPAAAAMLGYRPEELVGKATAAIMGPDQLEVVRAANARRAQGETDRYELILRRKDGSSVTVLVSGSPRFQEGAYVGSMAVFTDISELKVAQADVARRAEQLQALYQTSLEVNTQSDLHALLRTVVERATSLIGSNKGGLYLVDPGGESLALVVSHNYERDFTGTVLRLGEGVSGRVAQTGQLIALEDYQAFDAKAPAFSRISTRRMLAVPLRVADRVIGVINVADDHVGAFSDEEIQLVQLFADQAALAVENARLLASERERTRELERARGLVDGLSRMAAHFGRIQDPAKVMEVLGRELRAMGLNGSVGLLEQETGDLLVSHIFFDPGILSQVARLVGQSIYGARILRARMDFYDAMILQRQAQVVSARELMRAVAPDLPDPVVTGLLRLFHVDREMTTLCLPLSVEDKVLGALFIGGESLQERDLAAFSVFASQVAGVIEKNRLLEETRRRAVYLEGVTATSTALRAAANRAEMLPIIVEQVARLLRSPNVGIYLLASDTEAQMAAARGALAHLVGERRTIPGGLVGGILRSGGAFVTRDASRDERIARRELFHGLDCVTGVPLVSQDKRIGVVFAARPAPFEDEEIRLLTAIAEMAGNALNRAGVMETLEQRVTERTLDLEQANERLKELDKLKGEFVSNVSHELRTPITSIRLFLDLLKRPLAESRREEYLATMDRESRRLGGLIEDLLSLSRLDAGVVRLNLEPHPLDGLLGDVMVAQRARAEVKGLEVTHEPHPGAPPARVSREQMTQVLTNLVGNAVAYTPAGGRIVVETVRSPDRQIEVGARVWNSGPPIPEEDLPHLFERFFRGQTGQASGEAGTGLGLAICKEIVDRHGGRIEVVSSPEAGTSFTVWVPTG